MNKTIHELGVAVSHYHQKLGPQFVSISFDFTKFDNITQYNILQDSISTRSNDLALFISTKEDIEYIIRIKKMKIQDPQARGGIQRYALLFLIPKGIELSELFLESVYDDIKQKLMQGRLLRPVLQSWHKKINERYGSMGLSEEINIIKRFSTSHSTHYDIP